jgi:glycyl-tRNA synthetase beta chain
MPAMPELLFELGCEELPASSVRRAYVQLADEVCRRLDEAGLGHGQAVSLGTPRRLILSVPDVVERQPDSVKEIKGPALKAAFDSEGNPTKALEGFCNSQGVSPAKVERRDEYVWVTKKVEGKPAIDVLAEVLPAAVRALVFDKTMRWGSAKMRFARPIRWLLASYGGKLVPFDIEGVKSGLESRGHRFESPKAFKATDLASLLKGLRKNRVEPDPAEREKMIREGAHRVSHGAPDMPDHLVEENVFLTEWPEALLGDFPEEFMSLPEPVLVTAMAKHERFFPVRDSHGALTNRFVSIRNGGREDAVKRGNQWVLSARFNDAKFFFDEDATRTMADFLERTRRMTFAEGLGSIRQRAHRLSVLAMRVAEATGAGPKEAELAEKAGLYAKADLSSGLVSELASLQGIVGAEYAAREKFEPAVCHALATQYDLAKAASGDDTKTAVRLMVADQLDKLAGYLGLGQGPSGSSDPYGLRRAATVLIEASGHLTLPAGGYIALFEEALAQYSAQGFALDEDKAKTLLGDLFAGRYEALHPDARHDVLDAALLERRATDVLDPARFRLRLKLASGAAYDTEFLQTATRPINIVSAAVKKGIPVPRDARPEDVDSTRLDSDAGAALLVAAHEAKKATEGKADTAAIFVALKKLEGPINRFFTDTMVMVDDHSVRDERLKLLSVVSNLLFQAGDLSKIVIEG